MFKSPRTHSRTGIFTFLTFTRARHPHTEGACYPEPRLADARTERLKAIHTECCWACWAEGTHGVRASQCLCRGQASSALLVPPTHPPPGGQAGHRPRVLAGLPRPRQPLGLPASLGVSGRAGETSGSRGADVGVGIRAKVQCRLPLGRVLSRTLAYVTFHLHDGYDKVHPGPASSGCSDLLSQHLRPAAGSTAT